MSRSPVFVSPDGSIASYQVHPGDTIYKLIIASGTLSLLKPKYAIDLVMEDNPHIPNPDRIYPGQFVYIRNRNAVGNELAPIVKQDIFNTHAAVPDTGSLNFGGPAGSASKVNWAGLTATMAAAGSSGAHSQFTNIFRIQEASDEVQSVINSYHEWKKGSKSKHAHYKGRKQSLAKISNHLNSLEETILKGKTENTMKMKSGRVAAGVDRTKPMVDQATKLKKIASHVKNGGRVLGAAGVAVDVGFAHHDVCVAPDTKSKNKAFVGGTGGAIGSIAGGAAGTAAGTVVAVFFFGSNPVGWVAGAAILTTAAVAAIGGGIGSYVGSEASIAAYDATGSEYDIVGAIPISGGCSIYGD